jgi:hypothetical protein
MKENSMPDKGEEMSLHPKDIISPYQRNEHDNQFLFKIPHFD